MNIREQLFLQFAGKGLNQVLNELIKQYQPKKGHRFNAYDTTYEIGLPTINEKGIIFEISSKIPQDKLSNKSGLKVYFNAVKKIMGKEKIKPISIEMENIVHSSNKMEKSRDYVKLTYLCSFKTLYNEKEIEKEILSLSKNKDSLKKIPRIAGIVTIGGRLVLLSIKDNVYKNCKMHIQSLIKANREVKRELKIH